MKKLLLLFAYVLVVDTCFSQEIEWQKCLGGTNNEGAYIIQQTVDGGYVVTGSSWSNNGDVTGNHGSSDYWIVKIDSVGTIQWQKCFGGTDNDDASSIQQTFDGGYVVAGRASSNDGNVTGNHGGYDFWVIKLDGSGTMQWQKSFGGTFHDDAMSIQQTNDGGYVVTGYTDSYDGNVTGNHGDQDYWVIKLNGSGIMQWQKCFGGTDSDMANNIRQTSDGGYVITGTSWSNDGDVTSSHGNGDYWMIKIDGSGILQWQKCFGGSNAEGAYSLQITTDGGYVMSGYSVSNDGDVSGNHGADDFWVIKLDTVGTIQWQKCFGGTTSDASTSIWQTSDGGYVSAGWSDSDDGDVTSNYGFFDYWMIRLDSTGTLQWQKSLGGTSGEQVYSISQANDGGYIMAGHTASNDSDVTNNHGSTDYWIVKVRDTTLTTSIILPHSTKFNIQLFPNPANDLVVIDYQFAQGDKIKMRDVLGKNVFTKTFSSPALSFTLQTLNYTPGIYFVEVLSEKGKVVRKIVKQ